MSKLVFYIDWDDELEDDNDILIISSNDNLSCK